MIIDTTKAKAVGETELHVSRDFAAPPDKVWRGLTDPDLLRRWLLGPPGWEMVDCQMPNGPGPYLWRWRNVDKGSFSFRGEFTRWEAPTQLDFTQIYDPEDHGVPMADPVFNSQTLSAVPHGTRMLVVMRYKSAEDRAGAMATGMTEGMEMSYARLDKALT